MPKTPPEPTNHVLEQLRLMRADMNSRFDQMQQETNSRFDRLETKLANVERDLRGLKLNTIAEVYKANLTVASFADHERRIAAPEAKS